MGSGSPRRGEGSRNLDAPIPTFPLALEVSSCNARPASAVCAVPGV